MQLFEALIYKFPIFGSFRNTCLYLYNLLLTIVLAMFFLSIHQPKAVILARVTVKIILIHFFYIIIFRRSKKMQTSRKTSDKKIKLESCKDDLPTKKLDDKHKKSAYCVSTPRDFLQKTTTADIYARNNSIKTPKKIALPAKVNNASPMKDFLKSSPSSVSNRSNRNKKDESKTPISARTLPKETKNIKKVPFNVTVNSPIAGRKIIGQNEAKNKNGSSKDVGIIKKEPRITKDNNDTKIKDRDGVKIKSAHKIKVDIKNIPERRRTNTRTLEDEEIKVLTPHVMDNTEMLNLAVNLKAQPKAFFVDLNGETDKAKKDKSSEEEVSYEDDFESYESDFESYHSGSNSNDINDDNTDGGNEDNDDDEENNNDGSDSDTDKSNDISDRYSESKQANLKEERMLDSGNFELRDRSASKSKPMDFIREDFEEEKSKDNERKNISLDEGFQDMSSMKTLHVDVLERPLFIDFTKAKENRRKKRIFEKLKQRAQIILSMVTLHEMSYNLFEMSPIPYDVFMATYGRLNYKQIAVQTFEDGITEEIQTDEVLCDTKWTQSPIDFSNRSICFNVSNIEKKKDGEHFSFFTEELTDTENENYDYKSNPLRIYLEQRDGVGCDKMLPYQKYETKLKNNEYNVNKLKKFLKHVESRVSNILRLNVGNVDVTNIVKTSKLPFSNGYVSISTKDFDENVAFLKESQIIDTIFSETKNNLILTVHDKNSVAIEKCVLCLWDLSLKRCEPIKYLVATDNVKIGRFWGNTEGYFVGVLEDSSIHLWDLSEEATWCNDVAIDENISKSVENNTQKNNLTDVEKDREWNKKNSDLNCYKQQYSSRFQASAYTSSAYNICNNEKIDNIVGLEFVGEHSAVNLGNGRKVLRQVCTLQRTGIVTTWSIIHEKNKNPSKTDMGKAFWSKMSLEIVQNINLTHYLDAEINNVEINTSFNLSSAKKRLLNKRQERIMVKRLSHQKSLSTSDSGRPSGVASVRSKSYLFEITNLGESAIHCCHLKIVNLNNIDNFLVGKNCGELLNFRRVMGNVKIKSLCVANSASSITCIEVSPNNSYFLAATDAGTVHLCSIIEMRVLLTLDCRNNPSMTMDKYQVDFKGRFLGDVPVGMTSAYSNSDFQCPIFSLSHSHPLLIIAINKNNAHIWNLKSSDSKEYSVCAALRCVSGFKSLALLTSETEVQIYKLTEEQDQLHLFNKYVSLL